MAQLLLDEFRGLNNNQAYELAFNKRLLRPNPNLPGRFLGNSQRDDFLPHLHTLLRELPESAEIFDFGAGGGEIVDLALKEVASATINLEEPNPLLIAQYKERIAKSVNLSLGVSHTGPLQDYYGADAAVLRPLKQQDLALAIHMIYHLTDFTCAQIEPDQDLKQAIGAMYSFLKPGGVLFVVFANQLVSTTGQASRYYFQQKNDLATVQNLKQICESRDKLLRQGLIELYLDSIFPDSKAVIKSVSTQSCIFGSTREDIVAMCLTGELGEANDEPFDLNKLEILTEFINRHEQEIGLTTEDREIPQKGMVRSNQPQIITVIQRQSK
ncbi:MAG: class I SAM-dependent methyltransferase [Candidatus Obscuribacterales bacterium]|nr:class I SAM-dependent methyltransferase [Candidatus Obscuribacterales bacterium]